MFLEGLRTQVLEANLEVVRRGLAIYTFGNASGISRVDGLVVIKPSGVPYNELRPEHMAVVDMTGRIVDGRMRPSSDVDTHLALYQAFSGVGAIVHTHSTYATAWAQAGRGIPCYGTTHADYFRGAVPVTEPLTLEEVEGDYERNTGQAIVKRFADLDPAEAPGVLVAGHGPFAWGATPADAAHHAVILEELARIAYHTLALNPAVHPLPPFHADKHFLRKHGAAATYGQRRT